MKKEVNLYQSWASIDRLCNDLINDKELTHNNSYQNLYLYRIIRSLHYVDEIGINIMNSFCSDKHPEQIDDFKRLSWIRSLKENILLWHKLINNLLTIITNNTKISELTLEKTKFKDFNFIKLHNKFTLSPFL